MGEGRQAGSRVDRQGGAQRAAEAVVPPAGSLGPADAHQGRSGAENGSLLCHITVEIQDVPLSLLPSIAQALARTAGTYKGRVEYMSYQNIRDGLVRVTP